MSFASVKAYAVCVVIFILCICTACGDDNPCNTPIGDFRIEYNDLKYENASLSDGDTLYSYRSGDGGVVWFTGEPRPREAAWLVRGSLSGAVAHFVAMNGCTQDSVATDTLAFTCGLGVHGQWAVVTLQPDTITIWDFSFRVCCLPDEKCTDWSTPISFTLIDTLTR